uniref:Uncharacterized protein n=1 Tax=Gopherus evgoodei TaxID=1825980 RepID=A0A8C4YJA0_9SAUR
MSAKNNQTGNREAQILLLVELHYFRGFFHKPHGQTRSYRRSPSPPHMLEKLFKTRLNYSKNYAVEGSVSDECLSYYKDLCKAKLPQLPIIMKAKLFRGRIEKIKEVGRICVL